MRTTQAPLDHDRVSQIMDMSLPAHDIDSKKIETNESVAGVALAVDTMPIQVQVPHDIEDSHA